MPTVATARKTGRPAKKASASLKVHIELVDRLRKCKLRYDLDFNDILRRGLALITENPALLSADNESRMVDPVESSGSTPMKIKLDVLRLLKRFKRDYDLGYNALIRRALDLFESQHPLNRRAATLS